MAYVEQDSILGYFEPLFAPATQITLSAAAGDLGEYVCVKPCMVHRGLAVVTTAVVATTTAPTIVLRKRLTPGSATGQVTVMTITVPGGAPVGKVIYKDVEPLQFAVGDTLLISWTQGVGSAAGVVKTGVLCENSPKTPMENSDMQASI